jgi:hypothetical protein
MNTPDTITIVAGKRLANVPFCVISVVEPRLLEQYAQETQYAPPADDAGDDDDVENLIAQAVYCACGVIH